MRVRSLVVSRHYHGDNHKQIAKDYDVKESTIKAYIRRYEKTGSILSEYERNTKKNYKKQKKGKLINNKFISSFVLDWDRWRLDEWIWIDGNR